MPEPQRFGKYLLYERIAVGGMAEVFRAKPVGSDNLLALKRIHPHHLENDDFVSMLIDEAKISVQLSHPNVIQVVDLGRVENHYFIAMEFIRGRDLRRVMERMAEMQRPFPVEHAVSIIASVARGLDYAHGKSDARGQKMQIVHRDISPQNVLVGFDGVVKVIDFGIAKAAGRLMETQVGILKGKYAYMSPEQAAGGTLDHRTDIFSTGIMLYECALGKHPFRATHDIETLRNIKNSSFAPPHEVNPKFPGSVEAVIMKALAPKKEDRYFTAGAMADDLERALEQLNPDYSRDSLSEFVADLFSDEIAAGDIPAVNAPPEKKGTSGKSSMRLDRLTSNQMATVAAPQPSRIAGKPRPQEPVPLKQQGQAMVVSSGGFAKLWAGVRDGVRSFVARVQAGKLDPVDSIVLGTLTVAIVALALFILLYEPASKSKGAATPKPTATVATGASATPAAAVLLTIDSNPSGAQVRIGPRPVGTTPISLTGYAATQQVPVTIVRPGFEPWTGTVTPGQPFRADLRALPSGSLTVVSIPAGAEVRVDGMKMGETPVTLQLPEGDHALLVRDRSGAQEPRSVRVKAGGKATERFKLQ
ncbi:MAG TPA: serine/threonine-protein kinase [bacterium]|nr:serine/threonine-protein kinase [bacterium]